MHQSEKKDKSSNTISDIVIGMGDGLVVPFALATGLSAAVESSSTIVWVGTIAIAAGAVTMGVSGYMTQKEELEAYREELINGFEKVEDVQLNTAVKTKEFIANLGLAEDVQEQVAAEVEKDKKEWAYLLLQQDINEQNAYAKRAITFGMNIALSYGAAGFIPLLPYFFLQPFIGLQYSALMTLSSLFIFGWIKSRYSGFTPWVGALRSTIFGAMAAIAAFYVAQLF